MRCGLLGKKLGHSYSPQIHSYLADYAYDLLEKMPEELEVLLKQGDFAGLNVTMPYKKAVIPYLDELSERAAELGAVNTIVCRKDGTLIGHNTDYFGFQSMLDRSGLQVGDKKVLVLGNGGASATAVAVLKKQNANVVVISRNGNNNYSNLQMHSDAAVIVNTTPVGMYPNVGVVPVDLSLFPQLEGVLDVVYNPARTQLILDAENRGLITENGLWMLVAQAKESAEWFTGAMISHNKIAEIHRILRKQMENVVLVGMPGCGKSTIGKLLAQHMNKRFVDADEEIEIQAKMSIPEIFAVSGEAGFRKWETKILSELGKESGLVIATGGGCITGKQNYPILHQNGRIIWIRRDISKLPIDGRPLSQANNLEEMYRIRKPLYEAFADLAIDNNGSCEQTVAQILKMEEF